MFNDNVERGLSDAYDLVAFDFTEPVAEYPLLRSMFFSFDEVPNDVPNDEIIAFILSGYPFSQQKYELYEDNHIGLVRRGFVALPARQPQDEALIEVRFVKTPAFDLDGMSGGPAFVVQGNPPNSRAFFAGIVVRAGASSAYILKSGYINEFLRALE